MPRAVSPCRNAAGWSDTNPTISGHETLEVSTVQARTGRLQGRTLDRGQGCANVLKHAGDARATVRVRYTVDAIDLEIADDGPAAALTDLQAIIYAYEAGLVTPGAPHG